MTSAAPQETTTATHPPTVSGWVEIAKATTRAMQRSVTVATARRWAQADREPRLPVYQYGNGRVYMPMDHLALFAAAWNQYVPVGGRPPGTRKTRRGRTRRGPVRKRAQV